MLQNKNSKSGGHAGTIIDFKTQKRLREKRNAPLRRWDWIWAACLAACAVATPAFIGAVLGRWLDSQWGTPVSCSLALMFIGAALGCIVAWRLRRS